jgi:hypothetical protein
VLVVDMSGRAGRVRRGSGHVRTPFVVRSTSAVRHSMGKASPYQSSAAAELVVPLSGRKVALLRATAFQYNGVMMNNAPWEESIWH